MAIEPSAWPKQIRTILQSAFDWIARWISIGNIVGLTWIAIWVVICALVAQDLSRDVVTIEPISVPKTLSDIGYTPEVASHRLHDALNTFADAIKANSSKPSSSKADSSEANSSDVNSSDVNSSAQSEKIPFYMSVLNIANRDERTDFIVPNVGLSLNAVVSTIRSVLHYGSGQSISGEIIFHDKFVWLRLRVDGREVFTNSTGVAFERLDDLLAAAAPAVVERIRPYLAAAALYHDHPDQAVKKAGEIIDRVNASDVDNRLKESDVNVEWSYILKGDYFNNQTDYVQAETFLRKAVTLNWSNSAAHAGLGNTLRGQGKLDEAIVQYRRAVGINPRSAAARTGLDGALDDKVRRDRKLEEAIAELNRAKAIDPKSALAHNNLGLTLYHQGKISEAIAEYRRAIAIDPSDPKPHNNLGIVLHAQAKLDDAIAEYRRAIELDQTYAFAHYNLAIVQTEQGKLDDAIAEYRRAIKLDPNYAPSYNNLGNILRGQGKFDEAIAQYHRAIEIDPKYALPHHNFANVLRNQGKIDDAIVEYRRAIELDPKYVVAHYNLGDVLNQDGRADEAIAEYRRALEINPNYKNASENLEKLLRASATK